MFYDEPSSEGFLGLNALSVDDVLKLILGCWPLFFRPCDDFILRV